MDALLGVLEKYARADETVWVQEEPRNMGAWAFVERQLRGVREVRYVGRPERASPAEGWAAAHTAEQQRIVAEALGGVPAHAR
jgi:2-oxoglutarate dehydrogenase E1 component